MDKKFYEVQSIRADATYLHFKIDDRAYRIRWVDCSDKLAKASLVEKKQMKVSPSGYGIHWPLLDEDLAIKPLLELAEQVAPKLSKPIKRRAKELAVMP